MRRVLLVLVLLLCLCPSVWAADTCPPNLLIVLDKSGSMTLTPDEQPSGVGRPSKWTLAVSAVSRLLSTYGDQMSVGLSLFASDQSCGAAHINIPPGSATKAAILARLAATNPDSNTPTSTAVAAVIGTTPLKDDRRQQYILLLTDGAPNCVANPVEATVAAIEQARNSTPSIKTFVVGFGALLASEQAAMNRMAEAGGVPDTDPKYKYYRADNDTTLGQALDRIIAQIPPPPPPLPAPDMGSGGSGGGPDAGGPGYGTGPSRDMSVADGGVLYRPVTACDPPASTGDPTLPDGGAGAPPSSAPEDNCYLYPCKVASQMCIRGRCQAPPCAGVVCPRGQYCYTDGVQKGACVALCPMSCPTGRRCMGGQCRLASPCPDDCIPGGICDWGNATCSLDPMCLGVSCPAPTACRHGECIEDPCDRLVLCPAGTRCVRWFGTCEALPPPGSDGGAGTDLSASADADGGPGSSRRPVSDGACTVGGGSPQGTWPLLGLLILLLRRRRVPAAR